MMSSTKATAIRQRIKDGYIKLLQTIIRRLDPPFSQAFLEIDIVEPDRAVNASMSAPTDLPTRLALGDIESKMFVIFNYSDPTDPNPDGDLSEIASWNDIDAFLDELIQYQLGTLKIIIQADGGDIIEHSEELDWPGLPAVTRTLTAINALV